MSNRNSSQKIILHIQIYTHHFSSSILLFPLEVSGIEDGQHTIAVLCLSEGDPWFRIVECVDSTVHALERWKDNVSNEAMYSMNSERCWTTYSCASDHMNGSLRVGVWLLRGAVHDLRLIDRIGSLVCVLMTPEGYIHLVFVEYIFKIFSQLSWSEWKLGYWSHIL